MKKDLRYNTISLKSTIVALILVVAATALVSAAIMFSLNIGTDGNVITDYGLELYDNTQTLTSQVSWGNVGRNTVYTWDGSLKNIGNDVANVSLVITGLKSGLAISWNQTTYVDIAKDASLPIELSLNVTDSVAGSFTGTITFQVND